MQAQRVHLARALVARGDAREREVDRALPCLQQVRRHEILRKQPLARLAAEAGELERGPIGERARRAHRVNAPDEAADPLERLAVLELRRAPAAARKYREAKAAGRVRRISVGRERRDDRDLALGKLQAERVLLEDLSVGPARGTVELRDHRGRRTRTGTVFEPDLVDAVLVAVQREQPPVAGEAHARERVEHGIRGEPRVGRFGGHRAIVRAGKRKSARRRTSSEAGGLPLVLRDNPLPTTAPITDPAAIAPRRPSPTALPLAAPAIAPPLLAHAGLASDP